MTITSPRPSKTVTRYLTPVNGRATIGAEVVMAAAWQHGEHAHIALRHGTYGCWCTPECRSGGIKEWRP